MQWISQHFQVFLSFFRLWNTPSFVFTSYLSMFCFCCQKSFWPINTMFKRILKCHPNLIYFLKKKKKKTMAKRVQIVHLGEWNEVLSCCSASKLHLLCVKITCCSQDWLMNSCCNFCTQMSVESNWICLWPLFTVWSICDFELLLPVLLYSGYQDIVSTWLAAFLCPELIQRFDCMTL